MPQEQGSMAPPQQGMQQASPEAGGGEEKSGIVSPILGIVAGLALVIGAAAEVALSGVPEDALILAVVGLSLALGVFAAVASAVPLQDKLRSILLGMVGMMALLGFGTGLALGVLSLVSIALVVGAVLCIGGALVGRK